MRRGAGSGSMSVSLSAFLGRDKEKEMKKEPRRTERKIEKAEGGEKKRHPLGYKVSKTDSLQGNITS